MADEDDDEVVTLKVRRSTHKRLGRRGRKDQTYDNIIVELLDAAENER